MSSHTQRIIAATQGPKAPNPKNSRMRKVVVSVCQDCNQRGRPLKLSSRAEGEADQGLFPSPSYTMYVLEGAGDAGGVFLRGGAGDYMSFHSCAEQS